jgi:parallel beta-helix repeat protein
MKHYPTPIKYFLIPLTIFLAFASSALATTYYVDNSCSNNGNGQGQSCATSPGGVGPFNSLANAQSHLSGNQSDNNLLLKRGQTFSGQFTVGAYGTEGRPFTIGAYGGGENPIISGGGSCIWIQNYSYIVIDGITVIGATNQWQAGIYVLGPTAGRITIQNCTVHDCTYGGIFIAGASSYNVIRNNIVYNCPNYNGIAIQGSGNSSRSVGNEIYGNNCYANSTGLYTIWMDRSVVYNNQFHDNAGTSEEYGIGVLSSSNNFFYGNNIYANHNMGVQYYGDSPWGACNGNLFYQNWIHDQLEGNGFGMNISSRGSGQWAANNLIYYNIFSGNKVGIAADSDDSQSGGTIYNNIFYGHSSYGIWYQYGNQGFPIKNNIFSENTSCDIYAPSSNILTHSNNAYYRAAGGNRVLFNGITYTLATLKSGFEASALVANPKLSSSSDFRLLSDSPCINAGTNVGLTQDYEGKAISGLPDIGAYEYTTDAGISPPTGLRILY